MILCLDWFLHSRYCILHWRKLSVLRLATRLLPWAPWYYLALHSIVLDLQRSRKHLKASSGFVHMTKYFQEAKNCAPFSTFHSNPFLSSIHFLVFVVMYLINISPFASSCTGAKPPYQQPKYYITRAGPQRWIHLCLPCSEDKI